MDWISVMGLFRCNCKLKDKGKYKDRESVRNRARSRGRGKCRSRCWGSVGCRYMGRVWYISGLGL